MANDEYRDFQLNNNEQDDDMDLIYGIQKNHFEVLRNSMNVLYSQEVTDRIEVYIGQMIQHQYDFNFERSNHLGIIIVDNKTYRHIGLRLSSFRKVIKFLIKKDFSEARKLNIIEKFRLNRTWDDACEKLKPGYKENKKRNEKEDQLALDKALTTDRKIRLEVELESQKEKLKKLELKESKVKKKTLSKVQQLEKRLNKLK